MFAAPLRKEQQLTENYASRDKRKEANLYKTEIRSQEKNWAGKGSRETATQNGLLTNDIVKALVLGKNVSSIRVLWRMDKEEKIQVISKGSHSLIGENQHK